MKRLTITIAMLVAVAALAPAADASSRQVLIMQDDTQVHGAPAATLDEFASLGADVVKVNLYWDDVAPQGRRKPAGFDGSDPAAYDWRDYPALVQAILDRGMRPYFSLGGRAPDWATGNRGRRGTFRPSAREFRAFAEAAGQRFPGVDIWSIWNEPNLYSWLSPQRSKGVPVSPGIYRGLYLAGHRGLRESGHGDDTILLGELMPRGGSDRRKVRPLEFLREMVCLDRNYRQYRGAAARKSQLPSRGPDPDLGPRLPPLHAGRRAGRERGHRRRGDRPALARAPHARRARPPRQAAAPAADLDHRVRLPDQPARPQRHEDPPRARADGPERVDRLPQPARGELLAVQLVDDDFWQSGLYFADGRAKRKVYDAFRMPLFVRSLGRNAVEVFGGLRTPGGSARVESQAPGASYRSLGSVSVNSAGYFRRIFRVQGAFRHKFRVTIGSTSRVKKPVAR